MASMSFGATPNPQQAEELAEIRQLAYEYYLARGGAPGSAEEDWMRAEQEVRRRRASQQGGPSAEPGQTPGKRGVAPSNPANRLR